MRKKILVADDSITVQKVIEMAFSGSSYDVICAADGKKAQEKFVETLPDIVLADIIMPEMDGYSLCSAIKSIPEHAHVPVLLLSGAFEPFDREKAESSGADGIITKPFESKILFEKVDKMLNPPAIELPHDDSEQETEEMHVPSEVPGEAEQASEVEDFPVNLDDAIEVADSSSISIDADASGGEHDQIAAEAKVLHETIRGEESSHEEGYQVSARPPALRLTDDEIEAIARKLFSLIPDDTMKDVIRKAISEIAEKIIRERIREIEESASD